MKYVQAGSSSTLHIDFEVDGELVVPTSVTIKLSGNDGTAISGFDNASVSLAEASDTFVNIPVTQAANTKTLTYEFRHAEINFVYGSNNYTIRTKYLLTDRLDIPVEPQEVRNIIGLTEDEWPDDNIDIIGAYLEVDSELEASANSILNGGSELLRPLLEAIKYKAVIMVLPALELMATQSLQVDNTTVNRFAKVDFNALRTAVEDKYTAVLLEVDSTDSTAPTMATVGVGIDAVTGA